MGPAPEPPATAAATTLLTGDKDEHCEHWKACVLIVFVELVRTGPEAK